MQKRLNTIQAAAVCGALSILTAVALCACEAPQGPEVGSEQRGGAAGLPDTAGGLWEPCRFESGPPGPELDGWGCDGEPGTGLACLKPVTNGAPLSICAPYSAGGCPLAEYDGEAFGAGVDDSGAYCKPTCDDDADCLDGMECSPHGLCAWGHE